MNLGGELGAWIGFAGRAGFGWASFVLPLLCLVWAWKLWRMQWPETHLTPFTLSLVALLSSLSTFLALGGATEMDRTELGGVLGFILARAGLYYLGLAGTLIASLSLTLLSWVLVSGETLQRWDFGWLKRIGDALAGAWRHPANEGKPQPRYPRTAIRQPAATEREPVPQELDEESPSEPKIRFRSTAEPKKKPAAAPVRRPPVPGGFQLPSLDLLVTPPPISERQIAEDLQANARILEETLADFDIEAKVVDIERGPTVTRYELTPAAGVKLTRMEGLEDEIALVMKAASCHVIAPIPGKGRVGIDVPNTITTTVYLKELLTSPEFANNHSPLALPIGKDISGEPLVIDLRECPHLLIAGATGSGKTVCLNSLLVGILSHASPEQVKFLMIDPKMVELAMFNAIPHLVSPVVTSAKKASVALQWAVMEMERRYQLFARAGSRNITAYNARWANGAPPPPPKPAASEGEDVTDELQENGPLPYLVIVIDELADLMMVASADIENAITRLAAMSRAVGLHMVLATQRPSVDVITGVIKANFPARIAFQVASKVDSRTILDMNGADKLLGRGDLMFLRPGTAKPIRAQGALVTDAEIERVTQFLKTQRQPLYDERLMEHQQAPEGMAGPIERDEMYEQAKQVVLDAGQASTSLLQRRLRLGYGRAARILDLMEQEGLVGPPQGSRPREILVNRGS